MNIPIYRAKKINSDEYITGYLKYQDSYYSIYDEKRSYAVDISTLAIHFPNMLDSEGTKIFASLSGDGKGGDRVEGLCRDIIKDEDYDKVAILHRPLQYKGVVRYYNETSQSIVIETENNIHMSEKYGKEYVVSRGEALRWSDCRHNIKVVGMQE